MSESLQQFGDEQRNAINTAVQRAEARTTAEVVPIVARQCGRYDRAEDIIGLCLGALAMLIVWMFRPVGPTEIGDWGGPDPWVTALLMVGALFVGFVVGAWIASRWPALSRMFTPQRQMHEEVNDAARRLFFDRSIHHTQSGCGVLVFVALHERHAAVLADQTVLDALDESAITGWCKQLTRDLRTMPVTDALIATIDRIGDTLAEPLPCEEDDEQELPDALITID
jgi:putative membrane protein